MFRSNCFVAQTESFPWGTILCFRRFLEINIFMDERGKGKRVITIFR